jgi:plastocyanin
MTTRKILGIRSSVVIVGAVFLVVAAAIALSPLLRSSAYSGMTPTPNALADKTFPPEIYGNLLNQPSYVVNIDDEAKSVSFTPQVISVPVGMTVVWFNNGADEHTVTTTDNNGHSPPQAIDSDLIVAGDGSFAYTFTQPGTYRYVDRMDPGGATGIVYVGGTIENGNNFEMLTSGVHSAKSNSLDVGSSVTLRFIPKTVSIPPDIAVSYGISLSDSNGKLFTQQLDDKDGILDLELVSQSHAQSGLALGQQFTTWGPDFLGEEGYGNTGTFHIQGPILKDNGQYFITITMLDKDDVPLTNVSDTFALTPQNQ